MTRYTGWDLYYSDSPDDGFMAGVDWAVNEHSVQYISIVDPAVPGRYKVIGVLRDGHIMWDNDNEWINPSDAPMLSQTQDNSPMLSKNHKRK